MNLVKCFIKNVKRVEEHEDYVLVIADVDVYGNIREQQKSFMDMEEWRKSKEIGYFYE